jgi:hypothetical protein
VASNELIALTRAVAASGVATTVVSMGSPYTLPLFSEATARVCSYSTCDASLHATLQVLRGMEPAPGRLPCDLPLEAAMASV